MDLDTAAGSDLDFRAPRPIIGLFTASHQRALLLLNMQVTSVQEPWRSAIMPHLPLTLWGLTSSSCGTRGRMGCHLVSCF